MGKFRNYSNYEIYPDGKIWSYKKKKFLKPGTDTSGYKIVCLYDNEGNKKMYKLHRVVYESVTGEQIPPGMEINHISEDKTENFFSNMELVTHKENCNFGTIKERIGKAVSKALTNNPKRSKYVGAFKNGELIMTFPSTNEAGRNGFHQGNVSDCCRNCYLREGNNIYKGYEWRYL